MNRVLLALTLAFTTSPLLGETIVDGIVYPEITELGRPRATQGPVASMAMNGYANPAMETRSSGYRSTTIAPADLRPTIATSAATAQTVPAYNQAVYGRGYTSVGTPPRVVYVQPATYANTLPVQQPVQPITYVQPVTSLQPATSPGLVNLQPLNTTTAYNPYSPAKPGVPWRPIVAVRSMPDNYVVGQGIVGQPKVYVPSQPLRNFLRYITP